MPFNNVGFFAKRRGLGAQGGVAPSPGRGLVITPTISNNAETITWTIQSNMTFQPTLKYQITNLSNTDFTDGSVSGNITLNPSGGFTITRNLDKLANYSNSNVIFNLQLISAESNVLIGQSANAVVKPATPFVATGGNTSLVEGKFTVHTFTTTGNSNLTISALGDNPGNLDIRTLIVNGGSAGSSGSSYRESIFGAITNYVVVGGNGGGAGYANESNTKANAFSVGNIAVRVGTGASNVTTANTSSFNNVVATGNTFNAGASVYDPPGPYTRTSVAGGGGRGATANGLVGVANIPTSSSGGQGGAGYTTDITGTSVTYGCGGGGAAYGRGGLAGCSSGGNGGSSSSPYDGSNAVPNTGGGGGGGGPPDLDSIPDNTVVGSSGGFGASGIVVVRYLTRYRNMALT
jgi:hypothetical protein